MCNNRAIIAAQDWLGTSPVFYNKKTHKVSGNINNVIRFDKLEIDAHGLINYLIFGYSVFGRTPIKDVFFLRPNQVLFSSEDGSLNIVDNPDPCKDKLSRATSESDVWDIFSESVNSSSRAIGDNRVLIPTGGGYDSRLLNYFYPKKDKILSCTYGISSNQNESFETVNAREVCKRLGVRWERIDLGQFLIYFNKWDDLYGISTHAHGMYHWEFYSRIRDSHGVMPMLSGIVGDAWAGNPFTLPPDKPGDLISLGYSHGLCVDLDQCLLKCKNELLEEEFEKERLNLKNERYRVLYLVRTKMILLSYLMSVPKVLGFEPRSPFIDQNVAMSMLTIEPSRWRNRVWQKDFMAKHSLNVEQFGHKKSYRNDLNFDSMRNVRLHPLNVELLSQLFKREYIEWINKAIQVNRSHLQWTHWLLGVRKLGELLKILGLSDTALTGYAAYMVLKPIESVLFRAQQSNGRS